MATEDLNKTLGDTLDTQYANQGGVALVSAGDGSKILYISEEMLSYLLEKARSVPDRRCVILIQQPIKAKG